MINRCESCQGKKIVNGLGGMTKKCSVCSGVGFIKIEQIINKPQRGRKKKVEEVKNVGEGN